jgi:hypothetical protein
MSLTSCYWPDTPYSYDRARASAQDLQLQRYRQQAKRHGGSEWTRTLNVEVAQQEVSVSVSDAPAFIYRLITSRRSLKSTRFAVLLCGIDMNTKLVFRKHSSRSLTTKPRPGMRKRRPGQRRSFWLRKRLLCAMSCLRRKKLRCDAAVQFAITYC